MTDEAFGRTLGATIKAYRLRFGKLRSMDAFMRLSIVSDGLFRCEVVPPESVDSLAKQGRSRSEQEFVLWYAPDSKIRDEMDRLCADVLAGDTMPKRIKRPVSFLFGDDGGFRGWAK